jgi:cell division protein FtsI (penicillin-binding protein 3)
LWTAALGLRAGQIQLAQGSVWQEQAESQQQMDQQIAAPRGTILDRDGTALAVSRERYTVAVAADQISDPSAVQDLLVDALRISREKARSVTDPDRRWNPIAGRYGPATRELLSGIRGIYLERELERYHPHGDLARGVLGSVIDGSGQGGVEQGFDGLLSGHAGSEVVARDVRGQPIPGETFVVERPLAGGQVVLTIDLDLQEIAREALEEAIETTEARGGDVLVTDPETGEILALVSIRDGRTAGLSAINTAYEPGSTLKPFTVAGILSHGLGALTDTVDVEDGTWEVAGRTLHDVHAEGRMTMADALRVSSNVGIAKAAQALSVGQHYETLRDFGFGVPTGIEIPGEVGGTLRRPASWSRQSPASLAIGYEVSVTPLQMAIAYGALANGGRLMEPRLVKEIRGADGQVIESFGPQVVRRVAGDDVTRAISKVLVDVVEDGTGTEAQMSTFSVAGKSGTARAYSTDGGYVAGNYYSSFVGFFPAEAPQLVILVKLENPQGAYYGGTVAAPVTRATMEAALAARTSPLDRTALARAMQAAPGPAIPSAARFAGLGITSSAVASDGVPYEAPAELDGGGVPIPDVAGLPSRVAARRLHALGLRVERESAGDIAGTIPAAGTRALPGDTVRLRIRRRIDG